MSDEAPSKCRCGLIAKLSADPNVPVWLDPELNEYYLVAQDNTRSTIAYCPRCGGRTSESTRDALFTTPSNEEMLDLAERLRPAAKIRDVVRILGEPDRRFGPILHDIKKKTIYGLRDVKQTLEYTSLARTVALAVQEHEDGTITTLYYAQLRKG
jgi:hypothetical protein